MKKQILLLPMFLLIMIACSNHEEPEVKLCSILSTPNQEFAMSPKEAAQKGNEWLVKSNPKSRTEIIDFKAYPILKSAIQSRSSSFPSDTIAYVINYANDQGFVIMANDTRISRPLAYSEDGTFSFSNEIAMQQFIPRIEGYLQNYISHQSDTTDYDFVASCYAVTPQTPNGIHQNYPWNYYVDQVHPGCPVGCTALAAALLMTYCSDGIVYHGEDFPLCQMRAELTTGMIFITDPLMGTIERMAKLLYYIGMDLGATYTPDGTTAVGSLSRSIIRNLGFTVTGIWAYDLCGIAETMLDGYLTYFNGNLTKIVGGTPQEEGHSWIADGYQFCVDENNEPIEETVFLHFNWGWGGLSNGYYNGEILSTGLGDVEPISYFGVWIQRPDSIN